MVNYLTLRLDRVKEKFPHLARIAKKYLCVMATSTEAERTFSALGLLLTKQILYDGRKH